GTKRKKRRTGRRGAGADLVCLVFLSCLSCVSWFPSAGGIAMPQRDDRPPPEKFLSLIRQQQRGRLKVYLGFAAGVGKTFEMLQEGHRLKRQGVDVVIGVVETHGRAETLALVDDLEQVPRRRIEYRGVLLEEMDLDALLARRPQVALVDELAHTNAPGSRHG